MIFLFNWVIFRFHVNFQGCTSDYSVLDLFQDICKPKHPNHLGEQKQWLHLGDHIVIDDMFKWFWWISQSLYGKKHPLPIKNNEPEVVFHEMKIYLVTPCPMTIINLNQKQVIKPHPNLAQKNILIDPNTVWTTPTPHPRPVAVPAADVVPHFDLLPRWRTIAASVKNDGTSQLPPIKEISHLSKLPGNKKFFFGEPFYVLPKS